MEEQRGRDNLSHTTTALQDHRAVMPWSTLGPRPPLPCRTRLGRHTPAAFISRTGVVEVGALQEEHRASMPWSTLGPRPPLPCRTTAP